MRFNVAYNIGKAHTALASAVGWDGNTLVSGSDDQTVQRWSGAGQHEGQVPCPLFQAARKLLVDNADDQPYVFYRSALWSLAVLTCSGALQELESKIAATAAACLQLHARTVRQ